MLAIEVNEQSVFLNVPFDKAYERLFISLIAALVSIGRVPRCVLELPEHGQGRLTRIQDMIGQCRISIHDLSRVGTPVRFNMPFELGLACNQSRLKGKHDYILMEAKPYRLDITLSDIKGRDPLIHKGSARRVVNCILDSLGSRSRNSDPEEIFRLSIKLNKAVMKLKKAAREETVFTRTLFQQTVEAAIELAVERGFIN